jgi:hypothetical protein
MAYLVLAGTDVSDNALKTLRSGALRILDLSDTKITDAGLKHLCKPGIGERLTELNLTDTTVIRQSFISGLFAFPAMPLEVV